jgi:hypothetical protein
MRTPFGYPVISIFLALSGSPAKEVGRTTKLATTASGITGLATTHLQLN